MSNGKLEFNNRSANQRTGLRKRTSNTSERQQNVKQSEYREFIIIITIIVITPYER